MRKDEMEGKGFFVFDTEKRESVFHKIQSRPFFYGELEFKEAGLEEIAAKVRKGLEKLLENKTAAKPIIKLKLKGTVAKGLNPSDLDMGALVKEFENRAMVEIDKNLEFDNLRERIEKLRNLMESKLSVKEMGVEILKEKLKKYGFKSKVDVETLYSLLSEEGKGAADKVLKEILEM